MALRGRTPPPPVRPFDDEAGHDAYQLHPIHDRFRQECAPFWSKVLIYDAID
jgi:Stress responsive A/B Barrel Domain